MPNTMACMSHMLYLSIVKYFTHIKMYNTTYYMKQTVAHTLTYDYDKKNRAGLYFIAHTNNLTHRQLHTR